MSESSPVEVSPSPVIESPAPPVQVEESSAPSARPDVAPVAEINDDERPSRAERRAAGALAAAKPLASMSFDQRLELARKVKNEAFATKSDGDSDALAYFLKKQLQTDLQRERSRNQAREKHKEDVRDREEKGYTTWAIDDAKASHTKEIDQKQQKDVRSDRQRREDEREWRRQDRAHLRVRAAEQEGIEQQRRREDETRARERAEDERREHEIEWQRREEERAKLNRKREQLRQERKEREEHQVVEKHLRDSRQQLEEERQTNAASEWARVYERRQREQTRKLMRAAMAQRTYAAMELDEALLGNSAVTESAYREALRIKKRTNEMQRRVRDEEYEESELARWYSNSSLDRLERHGRALHVIKQGSRPPPIETNDS